MSLFIASNFVRLTVFPDPPPPSAHAPMLYSLLSGLAFAPHAAAEGPCDIYAAGGTPCVAAHSMVRALYGAYAGPLYLVQRASDLASTAVPTKTAGGYADSATQDRFCAGTSCIVTRIFDQTERGNHLNRAPWGGASRHAAPRVIAYVLRRSRGAGSVARRPLVLITPMGWQAR